MIGNNRYVDACNFALKCLMHFSEFEDSSIALIQAVARNEPHTMADYLAIARRIEPENNEEMRTSYFSFFIKVAEPMLYDIDSVEEFDAMTMLMMDSHKLDICEHGEECMWFNYDNVRGLLSVKYCEGLLRDKVEALVAELRAGQQSSVIILNPPNTEEFTRQMLEDVRSGYWFRENLFNAKLGLSDDNFVWVRESDKESSRATEGDYEWDEVIYER